tara:strand:- start:357 stop:614 length:258 start_codon:yes stop_codon:yes gene_type:complete
MDNEEKSTDFMFRKLITLGRLYANQDINEKQYTAKCYEILFLANDMHKNEIMFTFQVSKATYWNMHEFYNNTFEITNKNQGGNNE